MLLCCRPPPLPPQGAWRRTCGLAVVTWQRRHWRCVSGRHWIVTGESGQVVSSSPYGPAAHPRHWIATGESGRVVSSSPYGTPAERKPWDRGAGWGQVVVSSPYGTPAALELWDRDTGWGQVVSSCKSYTCLARQVGRRLSMLRHPPLSELAAAHPETASAQRAPTP